MTARKSDMYCKGVIQAWKLKGRKSNNKKHTKENENKT